MMGAERDDVSRGEDGRFTLGLQNQPVRALSAPGVDSVTARFEAKGVSLIADADPGVVAADPQRVGQILGNLLDNALRHTQTGGTVRVSALELLGTWTYEMVFMDCHLPGIDGFDATRALRASTGWATPNDVAVLALTADRRGADVAPCMAAGMNAHLSKPASLQTLAAAIEHWMPVRVV